MKRRTSLKDIAKELGVSISTVSRALKNHPDISRDMTERVNELAIKWHYMPNPLAMGLLQQKSYTIGVVVPDIVTHFYASIISGIEDVAKENGYHIIITSSRESYDNEKESIINLLKLRVDGLIVCLAQDTSDFSHFDQILEAEIPIVFFDRVCRTHEFSSVTVDNEQAAFAITQYFHNSGCKRIAHIAGPNNLNISKERVKGYQRGLSECGILFDTNLLIHGNLSLDNAAMATQKLLALKYPPDAIFGVNDTVIFAALKVIKEKGLRIPEDVSLIGFTDNFHATVVDPPLTAVLHPTVEIGSETARLLFRQINTHKNAMPQQVILQTKLVVRKSTRS